MQIEMPQTRLHICAVWSEYMLSGLNLCCSHASSMDAKECTDIKMKAVGRLNRFIAWPRGYKTFFLLNSTEHETFPAHKC